MNIRISSTLIAAIAMVFAFSTEARAQERPFEISIDGGLGIVMPAADGADNTTLFNVPSPAARLGLYLTDRLELDGTVDFNRVSQGAGSSWSLALTPGLAYHFSEFSPDANRTYVSGLVSMLEEDDDDTQFGLGANVGTKIPVMETAFVRLEAAYLHYFDSTESALTDNGAGVLSFTVGLGAILN